MNTRSRGHNDLGIKQRRRRRRVKIMRTLGRDSTYMYICILYYYIGHMYIGIRCRHVTIQNCVTVFVQRVYKKKKNHQRIRLNVYINFCEVR